MVPQFDASISNSRSMVGRIEWPIINTIEIYEGLCPAVDVDLENQDDCI